MILGLTSSGKSTSPKKQLATDSKASSGQLKNQSILVLDTIPGKLRHLMRRESPAGDIANIMCKLSFTFSRKQFHLNIFFYIIILQVVFGLSHSFLFGFISHFIAYLFLAVVVKQSRNHSNSQHIINQLQEPFFHNMRVSEQKYNLFDTENFIQFFQILSEIFLFVTSGKSNLEHLTASHIGR